MNSPALEFEFDFTRAELAQLRSRTRRSAWAVGALVLCANLAGATLLSRGHLAGAALLLVQFALWRPLRRALRALRERGEGGAAVGVSESGPFRTTPRGSRHERYRFDAWGVRVLGEVERCVPWEDVELAQLDGELLLQLVARVGERRQEFLFPRRALAAAQHTRLQALVADRMRPQMRRQARERVSRTLYVFVVLCGGLFGAAVYLTLR